MVWTLIIVGRVLGCLHLIIVVVILKVALLILLILDVILLLKGCLYDFIVHKLFFSILYLFLIECTVEILFHQVVLLNRFKLTCKGYLMFTDLAVVTLSARWIETLLSTSVWVVHLYLKLVLNIFVKNFSLSSLVHFVRVSALWIILRVIVYKLLLTMEQCLEIFVIRVALMIFIVAIIWCLMSAWLRLLLHIFASRIQSHLVCCLLSIFLSGLLIRALCILSLRSFVIIWPRSRVHLMCISLLLWQLWLHWVQI